MERTLCLASVAIAAGAVLMVRSLGRCCCLPIRIASAAGEDPGRDEAEVLPFQQSSKATGPGRAGQAVRMRP